jgi:hypothetical protein
MKQRVRVEDSTKIDNNTVLVYELREWLGYTPVQVVRGTDDFIRLILPTFT